MKANEFVKKFGWEEANSFVNWHGGKTSFKFLKVKEQTISVHSGDQPYDFHIDALKRLIESHELVKDYYGLTKAKEHAESNYTAPEIKDALKQAIADVEACKEVSSESN